MFVIKHAWIFFLFSSVLVLGSIFAIASYGLNFGIDFRGGSILEAEYSASSTPSAAQISQVIKPLNLGEVLIQPTGTQGIIMRLSPISEESHQQILSALRTLGPVTEKQFNTVGPTLGQELAKKGSLALALAVFLIIIYIAIAFHSVSKPVSSWKYGVIAILALVHDVTIPTGVFALLGHFRGIEIDSLFLTALLTVFGLSVSDTIVVFDRIRENLRRHVSNVFEEVVGRSLTETYVRSFNTSFTIILALAALLLFGGESTRYFALALMVGMAIGTYSSIFIASPLLVVWYKWQNRRG